MAKPAALPAATPADAFQADFQRNSGSSPAAKWLPAELELNRANAPELQRMKSALLAERDGLRTFVIVMATDEEALNTLTAFAAEHRLAAQPVHRDRRVLAGGRRIFRLDNETVSSHPYR